MATYPVGIIVPLWMGERGSNDMSRIAADNRTSAPSFPAGLLPAQPRPIASRWTLTKGYALQAKTALRTRTVRNGKKLVLCLPKRTVGTRRSLCTL